MELASANLPALGHCTKTVQIRTLQHHLAYTTLWGPTRPCKNQTKAYKTLTNLVKQKPIKPNETLQDFKKPYQNPDIGALTIRIGFWCQYDLIRNPPKQYR